MKSFLLLAILFLIHWTNGAFPNFYPKFPKVELGLEDDPGQPLILTPLIEQNKIEEAQSAAKVSFNGFKKQASYSGKKKFLNYTGLFMIFDREDCD